MCPPSHTACRLLGSWEPGPPTFPMGVHRALLWRVGEGTGRFRPLEGARLTLSAFDGQIPPAAVQMWIVTTVEGVGGQGTPHPWVGLGSSF